MFTSYYANVKNLDKANIPHVAISLYPPKWYSGPSFKALAPTNEILMRSKRGIIDQDGYVFEYQRDVLWKHTPQLVYDCLVALYGDNVALLCFERPSDFCHRHIVALWFEDELGIKVPEWCESHHAQTVIASG